MARPLRVEGLGLGKEARAARRAGRSDGRQPEVVPERLARLRAFRSYAGYAKAPGWLWTDELAKACGGRTLGKRERAVREHTEAAVREGKAASPWEALIGGMVLGTAEFARRVIASAGGNEREQKATRVVRERATWEAIVKAVEAEKGESWVAIRDRHGDWGRDVALWLGRTLGRLRLGEVADRVGGLDYTAVSTAVRRVARRREGDREYRATTERITARLSNI